MPAAKPAEEPQAPARPPASLRPLSYIEQVRATLAQHLPDGESTLEQIAGRLSMNARTLRRRLNEEGKDYTQVLDELRRELALAYMRNPYCNPNEVAELLGFSQPSTFTKAFRRWTGRTPAQYLSRRTRS